MLAVALLFQAIAGPPVPRDLRKPVPRSSTPCPTNGDGGEIIVCARPTDQRLGKLPEHPVDPILADSMSFRLPGGGTGDVHAVQSNLPGASGSGAVMTLRIPLGKGKRAGQ